MNYSKIKKIKAANFRSLKMVEIDMTDSPIIALTGSNEGGKSSVIRAFGAAAGNLWRTKQNQYIRTGTDGFAVVLELDDGSKVMRKKTSVINGYTLILPDGTRRDATKIDVAVPDYIEAVMGMSRDPETGESLQIRTYDDPLLFVSTTDGQNYKVLHNAINNLDVREATMRAKSDSSSLLTKAEQKRNEIEIYNRQLSELPLLDTEYLQMILSALERASALSAKFDTGLQSYNLCNSLDGGDSSKKLKKCKVVDVNLTRLFTDAIRHFKVFKDTSIVSCDNVETVNATLLSFFERGCSLITSIKKNTAKEIPPTVEIVSDKALVLFEKARETRTLINEATESYNKLIAGIAKVSDVLRQSGMRTVNCDKCGNVIVVPVGIS